MLCVLLAVALTALPTSAAPLPPATLRLRLSDPDVIRAAVKEAVANTPVALSSSTRTLGADPYRGFAEAVDDARVPSCLHPDALKHQPPKIGPVGIGGIYALPFLAAAILRGKCN